MLVIPTSEHYREVPLLAQELQKCKKINRMQWQRRRFSFCRRVQSSWAVCCHSLWRGSSPPVPPTSHSNPTVFWLPLGHVLCVMVSSLCSHWNVNDHIQYCKFPGTYGKGVVPLCRDNFWQLDRTTLDRIHPGKNTVRGYSRMESWGRDLGTRRKSNRRLEETAYWKSSPFILITKYYSSDQIQDDGLDGTFGRCGGKREMYTGICVGNLRERDNLQDLGVYGRILEWTLKKWDGRRELDSSFWGDRNKCRPVVKRVMNTSYCIKCQEIFWLVKKLLAS